MGNSWQNFVYAARVLRPLPFGRPNELVQVWEKPPGFDRNAVSPLNFLDWSEQNQVFASMTGVSGNSRTMISDGIAERIHGQAVTLRFFDVLGVAPAAGRTFTAEDAKPGTKVVVVSEAMWRTRFGANPKLVGSSIVMDGEPWTVIGVMPANFEILYEAEYWTLFNIARRPELRQPHYLRVFARLKPGVTVDQAHTAMDVIGANIARDPVLHRMTQLGWLKIRVGRLGQQSTGTLLPDHPAGRKQLASELGLGYGSGRSSIAVHLRRGTWLGFVV